MTTCPKVSYFSLFFSFFMTLFFSLSAWGDSELIYELPKMEKFPLSPPLSVKLDSLAGSSSLEKFSISAWIKPTSFDRYNEILRQEAGEQHRILFSLQEFATILSLGLGIGGYMECDAPIDRDILLDGSWHHAVATFDGQWMRVYFDGIEIGSLHRPGTIAINPNIAMFIGSQLGTTEFFTGEMGEISVRRDTISAEAIEVAYREGLNRLEGDTYVERLTRQAASIANQLTEYMPLTDDQWKYLPQEQRNEWQRVLAISKALENPKENKENCTVEALQEMIKLGRTKVTARPSQQEPVAPYRTPETPKVKDFTTDQAKRLLEEDWLHQADGNPSRSRIVAEIQWAREIAIRITAEYPDEVDFTQSLRQLDELEKLARQLSGPDVALYFRVRAVKREIAFANPVLDFDSVLYVDRPFPDGSEWQHETRHRLGYMSVPGGRLMTLSGLSPNGKQQKLMPGEPLHGTFWRPDLSHDAKRVLVSFMPHNEKAFHLYEVNIDGTGLRQLTSGSFDDLDPVYLPDGKHLVFTTTRGHTYVRCMPPTNAYVLARMTLDSKDLYLISRNNEPDYLPSVLNDGRIIYTRWEYTDKPLWRAQSLWTMNPDGTQTQTFWGNQSVWPDLLKDARAIPGSSRVMFTGSAHHNWFAGSVGIVDPTKGLNFPDGLTKVTGELPWPESGNGPVDPLESTNYHESGRYEAYYSPYPLSEKDFLVSANRAGRDGKFVLYLMDADGNRELIHEGVYNIFDAQPIREREVPPTITDRVEWPTWENRLQPVDGVIYTNNVYDNAPEELREKAKYLRVLNIEPKTYTTWNERPYISTGPVVSMVQSEGVKRILGTVEIEEDGSVAFNAPSGVALHFQLLDEKGRCLQTMRSFTGVMPGEQRGCLGCHESHLKTPILQNRSVAMSKSPQDIVPPPWEDRSISYDRYVQPVLDRYCGECHQGEGEGRKTFDMTRRPGFLMFDEPYVTLIGAPNWGGPGNMPTGVWGGGSTTTEKLPPGFGIADTIPVEAFDQRDPAAYQTLKPMKYLSYVSRLVKRMAGEDGHYNKPVDDVNLQRIIVWIDAICPYKGSEEVRSIPDPNFQGVDWLSIRPRIETAPEVARPGPFDPFGNDAEIYAPPSDRMHPKQSTP